MVLAKTMRRTVMVASDKIFYCISSLDSTCFYLHMTILAHWGAIWSFSMDFFEYADKRHKFYILNAHKRHRIDFFQKKKNVSPNVSQENIPQRIFRFDGGKYALKKQAPPLSRRFSKSGLYLPRGRKKMSFQIFQRIVPEKKIENFP